MYCIVQISKKRCLVSVYFSAIFKIAARSSGASSGQRSITVLNSGSISHSENKPETSVWLLGIESFCVDSVSNVFSRASELRLRGFEPLTFGSVDRHQEQVNPEQINTYASPPAESTPQLTPGTGKQGQIDTSELPPDLAKIVAAWPKLPEHIRQALLALVASANADSQTQSD